MNYAGGKSGKRLTKRQQAIMEFIKAHRKDRGYPPSIREIGEEVGLSSSSTVHSHLRSLETKGYIRRNPSKPRGITILGTIDGAGCCEACGERPGATRAAKTWKSAAKSIRARAPVIMGRRGEIQMTRQAPSVPPVAQFLVNGPLSAALRPVEAMFKG